MTSGNGETPHRGGSGGGPGAPTTLVEIARFQEADGQSCYVAVDVDAAGVPPALAYALGAEASAIEAAMPSCGRQAATPGRPVVPLPSPEQVAEAFWYTVHLPVPRPTSRPDYATTGKPTYLQTGDTVAPPAFTRPTPLGALTVTARGTYTVDWGDATRVTGPYTTPGGPYPTGTVTHTYDTTGTVTITVTERWTAVWTIGAAHGTLTDLATTGTLPDFPVRQLQAVITG